MPKLSLTMIVKNESEKIARCLNSVKHIVDEIILVDTGSTDNTKVIAQSFGAKIFDFKWTNNFADARNFALHHSTGDWNLVLDADEYFLNDYQDEIRGFINSNKRIGRIKRLDLFQNNGEVMESQVFISRILPKDSFYQGIIHEQVISEHPLVNTTIEVLHDGYLQKNKSDRNLKLLHQALDVSPNDSYLLFQIAKEYRMVGNYEIANVFFAKCYSTLTKDAGFRPLVIVDYLYNIIASKNLAYGLNIISQEENNLYDYPDFHFVSGQFFMDLVFSDVKKYINFFPRIEKAYLTCLTIGESSKYDSVRGTGSYRAAYNLGVYYETLGDIKTARKYYELSAKDNYRLAIEHLAKL